VGQGDLKRTFKGIATSAVAVVCFASCSSVSSRGVDANRDVVVEASSYDSQSEGAQARSDGGLAATDRGGDGPVETSSRDSGTVDMTPGHDGPIESGDSGTLTGNSNPSCAAMGSGLTTCGPGGSGHESCCTSLEVTGGTFYRSYDGVKYTDKSNPATVSSYRLDKYEITVGRFRQFVAAIIAGWRPMAGSGKHTHLNGGKGLNATGGGYEAGWDANWNAFFLTSASAWNTNLAMAHGTWTPSPGTNENKPISNETWYDAYAFCIWDGGFLPSEAEWNYAAAGGGGPSGQRVYPWSIPSTSTTIDCSYANYAPQQSGTATTACTTPSCVGGCPADAPSNVGTESPKGDGAYGQTDLSGNIEEWTLDHAGAYVTPCLDCANLSAASPREWRGGGWSPDSTRDGNLVISYRFNFASSSRFNDMGARCARVP